MARSPESSRLSVVIVVDVGDDLGEANDAGSVGVLVGSPGNTEGSPLLGTSSPATTTQQ